MLMAKKGVFMLRRYIERDKESCDNSEYAEITAGLAEQVCVSSIGETDLCEVDNLETNDKEKIS